MVIKFYRLNITKQESLFYKSGQKLITNRGRYFTSGQLLQIGAQQQKGYLHIQNAIKTNERATE